jgi:hypothetical protein
MGTSQSINPSVKDNPQWGEYSKVLTSASKENQISEVNLQRIMQKFVSSVGGASSAGGGNSKSFGKAGISKAQKILSYISNVQTNGFSKSLSDIGLDNRTSLSVNDFINALLIHCADDNSTFDETAANSALEKLIKFLLNDVQNIDDVELTLNNIDSAKKEEAICHFLAHYIVEFSDNLFSNRIYEKDGNKVRTFQQVFEYIKKNIENISTSRDLTNINWLGQEGAKIISEIQTQILEIFE